MSSALRIINTRRGWELGFGFLLLILSLSLWQVGETKSISLWNEASYDASLDPIIWSLPFVQDTVRSHRTATQFNPQQLNPYQQINHRRNHNHQRRKKPCPELIKRRRQQSLKFSKKLRANTNYKKYVHRRRRLMLQTRC